MKRAHLWIPAFVFALVSCDGGEVTVENPDEAPPSRASQNTGVADDGSLIVFAGPRREGTVRGERSADYDEERLIRTPNQPDPEGGEFSLEEAVVGLPIDGKLILEARTELGTILCELYAERTPNTVANFVGLARGLRPWWDARAGEWVRRPYYEDLTFHRVIPGYMIQAGDYLADGTGTVGYTIDDEPHDTLVHDRAGQLAMANADGENSAGAQFFITDGAAPQLDAGGYTIFGECRPAEVVSQIARVPQDPDAGNRPRTAVHLERIRIRRVVGGLAAATPTRPRLPEGEPAVPRGASAPPGSDGRYDPRAYGEPSPLPHGRTGPPSPPRRHRH